jgi:hypothetical protein
LHIEKRQRYSTYPQQLLVGRATDDDADIGSEEQESRKEGALAALLTASSNLSA